MPRITSVTGALALALAGALALSSCSGAAPAPAEADAAQERTLTVYSGRDEELVAPLIEQFEEASGIDVEVRYAGSTELAAQILEERPHPPAQVFLSQDSGSLGALERRGPARVAARRHHRSRAGGVHLDGWLVGGTDRSCPRHRVRQRDLHRRPDSHRRVGADQARVERQGRHRPPRTPRSKPS